MAESRSLPVPEGLSGERVDTGLARLLGISRSQAAELAGSGAVKQDGKTVGKSDRLVVDSWLDVALPSREQQSESPPELVPGIVIRYDDDDVVVVDKPVGVAAHSSVGWSGPTVVGALAALGYRISTSGAPERQGIVQRLDVGTSGLMMVAKSELAYSVLKNAFRHRTIDKEYHSIVQGLPDPSRGTIDAPIGRHRGGDYRFAVMATGKESITHYEVIEAFPAASLLQVHLETGRTHQIRVHFSALRHPCVGDLTYGADPRLAQRLGLERQWLHAMKLSFNHPRTEKRVVVESEYPDDLAVALERLRAI